MKIVYFGTPYFAAEILRYLLDHSVLIAAVVTRADRPKGRSLQMASSPVKALLLEKAPQIPLLQPEKASAEPFLAELAHLKADLFVVAAYGQIFSQKLLDLPPLGCINVHPSLLPKYRGPTPIQGALLDGAKETGVSIQKMAKQMDAGDVIASAQMEIPPDMVFGELEEALCALSKPLLLSVLEQYEEGIPFAVAQDHDQATYTSKIELEGGEIDWNKPASQLHNLIRAYSPRPGAWTLIQEKRLKVLRSRLHPQLMGKAKEILSLKEAIIACGQGALQLIEVQPEGKKAMSGSDWLRGQKFSSSF